ncbi:MAG: hypothetical protein M1832_006269 [Thelocarpon impressellum]|nr:MAG: hypothetical protein M1832_006269 [Thelocarpon impressellum]
MSSSKKRWDTRLRERATDEESLLEGGEDDKGPRAPSPEKDGLFVSDQQDGVTQSEEENEDDDEDDQEEGEFARGVELNAPRHQIMSISKVVELFSGEYLDLNPEYQREVVWSKERMSGLISSIMDNYYVPPVLFNMVEMQVDVAEGTGRRWKRVVVDGKQRLTSIRCFINGEIPVVDARGSKWYYADTFSATTGKEIHGHRILPNDVKAEFRQKSLVCYEFRGLSRSQEEDLFQRVQKGMALNYAEKFRATKGPWQELASLYKEDFKKVGKVCRDVRNSMFRNILTCFSQILEVDSRTSDVPKLKSSPAAISKVLSAPHLLTVRTKNQLRQVFTTFEKLLDERRSTFGNNGYTNVKTFAPVEMVSVAVLLYLFPERPRSTLHGDILYFRKEMRRAFTDLKLNAAVWKGAWNLLSTLESVRGATDGTTRLVSNNVRRSREADAGDASGHESDSSPESNGIVYRTRTPAKTVSGRRSTNTGQVTATAPMYPPQASAFTTPSGPGVTPMRQPPSASALRKTNMAGESAGSPRRALGRTDVATSIGRDPSPAVFPMRAAPPIPAKTTGPSKPTKPADGPDDTRIKVEHHDEHDDNGAEPPPHRSGRKRRTRLDLGEPSKRVKPPASP